MDWQGCNIAARCMGVTAIRMLTLVGRPRRRWRLARLRRRVRCPCSRADAEFRWGDAQHLDGAHVSSIVSSMMKRSTKSPRCARCGRIVKKAPTGRPPKFCGASCRQAAYLARKANRLHPVTLLAADLSRVHVREFLRREIWNVLQQAGLVSAPEPPPMRRRRGSEPDLRLVGPEDPGE
jgi:ribosomal protein L34E